MNGFRLPPLETTSLTFCWDRVDKESSEVTYVSTANIRVTGSVEFEVYEKDGLILYGSLERMDADWTNGNAGLRNDSKTGWIMDCHVAMSIELGSSAFFQPKLGVSAPAIEVYVAGCCSDLYNFLNLCLNREKMVLCTQFVIAINHLTNHRVVVILDRGDTLISNFSCNLISAREASP
ncbi:hypothetical protein K1719_038004 [Acacia pycnantha]|nr:hypothetical protein K1719_038004 [Acacia pycnantha]